MTNNNDEWEKKNPFYGMGDDITKEEFNKEIEKYMVQVKNTIEAHKEDYLTSYSVYIPSSKQQFGKLVSLPCVLFKCIVCKTPIDIHQYWFSRCCGSCDCGKPINDNRLLLVKKDDFKFDIKWRYDETT